MGRRRRKRPRPEDKPVEEVCPVTDPITPPEPDKPATPFTPKGPFIDLTGQRFERLTVMRLSHRGPGGYCWLCRCDCGNITVGLGATLRSGRKRSCGCLQVEKASAPKPHRRNPEGRMTSARLYRHRKSQGLCPGCGGQPDDGKVQCSACRKKAQDYQNGWRQVATE